MRKFRPGQLIARVSKRSAVVQDTYGKYYRDTTSNLKDQFENAKAVQAADQSINKVMGGKPKEETSDGNLMSSYVVKLTKNKQKVDVDEGKDQESDGNEDK